MNNKIMSTTLEIARETGWISTLSTAQKALAKVTRTVLAKLGVSAEWLKTKQAKVVLGVTAPAILGAIVWSLPMSKPMKDRILGYLKQAIIMQLAQLLGDSFSGVVSSIVAITGEVGALSIDKAEKDEDTDDH